MIQFCVKCYIFYGVHFSLKLAPGFVWIPPGRARPAATCLLVQTADQLAVGARVDPTRTQACTVSQAAAVHGLFFFLRKKQCMDMTQRWPNHPWALGRRGPSLHGWLLLDDTHDMGRSASPRRRAGHLPPRPDRAESTRVAWPLVDASPICALYYLSIQKKAARLNGCTICNHFKCCRFMTTGRTDTISPASYIAMKTLFLFFF